MPSWEEAPQVPRLPPPVHKTKVPLAVASGLFRAHELSSYHSQGSGPSSGSPERGKDVGLLGKEEKKSLRSSGFLEREDEGWEGVPRAMTLIHTSLRCRWAQLPKAADGGVSAVTIVPGPGLGCFAC
jgi:hypothetical protein